MEGSASVRKSLSGTLVPSSVSTVALLQKPEENTGKISRKVLDEEEYIEVSTSFPAEQHLCQCDLYLLRRSPTIY